MTCGRVSSEGLATGSIVHWGRPEPGTRGPPRVGHRLLGPEPSEHCRRGRAALSEEGETALHCLSGFPKAAARNFDPLPAFRPWAGSDADPDPAPLSDDLVQHCHFSGNHAYSLGPLLGPLLEAVTKGLIFPCWGWCQHLGLPGAAFQVSDGRPSPTPPPRPPLHLRPTPGRAPGEEPWPHATSDLSCLPWRCSCLEGQADCRVSAQVCLRPCKSTPVNAGSLPASPVRKRERETGRETHHGGWPRKDFSGELLLRKISSLPRDGAAPGVRQP